MKFYLILNLMKMKTIMKIFLVLMVVFLSSLGETKSQGTVKIDVSGSDTSFEFSIDYQKPFSIYVETIDLGTIRDGELYIYNKTSGSGNWNLVSSEKVPIPIIDSLGNYLIINNNPICKDWLVVYDKNSSNTGKIFFDLESLGETTGGGFLNRTGIRLKNYNSDRISNNRVIDITPNGNEFPGNAYDSTIYTNDGDNIDTIKYYMNGNLLYKNVIEYDGSIPSKIYIVR